MSLAEAASAIQGRVSGPGADAIFGGVSTDSRSLARGELFVAIRGERFDGHRFLGVAKERGAAGALVDEKYAAGEPLPRPGLPLLVVGDDTRKGLGRLGRHWRLRFAPALIAITGSNGKTTTKEMLASILRAHAGEAGALHTQGNLNTDIGVPLTLLRMRATHRYCAIELGMNHPGEIAELAAIALPTIALVNNAQREHQEFMHSIEAVAAENASVFEALPEGGIAVLNAEDAMAPVFRAKAGARKRIEFGLAVGDVTGRYAQKGLESEIVVRTPAGEAHAKLAIPGLHNVRNALAAAACAHAAGVAPAAIGAGLSDFRPYSGRLQVKKTAGGATLIDDTYNANPDSVRAAIDVLAACPGPTALVLGDMGEVGEQGPEFHAEVGRYAQEKGIRFLLSFGAAAKESAKAFGGTHVEDLSEIKANLQDARTILVKGSRFMRMERVVELLTGEKGGAH
ncbi:MAG TPA: UDP-N-acetylmuramoyl-tripeptide--D-alanyl-D-alanine ligase [Burkholderiales bacterium]|nr:UDP-N-acetylmuramoyl-tripeptide--D-alanyl-D-alanine ligase [Burkholderiales bacterium]